MSILTKIFGDPNARLLKLYQPLVEVINDLEPAAQKLSDEELKGKTTEFKNRLEKGETLDDLLPEAFATVREAAKRVIGQRHFDVQLLGGVFLHHGYITEMKTGEGKTLTATAAVYLNALTGQGAHVVTVNDYLAKRDAVWMGRIYHALGLSVGCIQQQLISYIYEPGFRADLPPAPSLPTGQAGLSGGVAITPPDKGETERGSEVVAPLVKVEPSHLRPVNRREAYQCDIVYGTNNEYGFDYLRDNMTTRPEDMSQRPLHYAVVDEIDSILIDEARTPLIISAPAEEATEKYYKFAELVGHLVENEDFNIDEKLRSATFTESGIERLEKSLGVENIYAEGGVSTVHHLEQALKAHALFKCDRDYIVKEGEVIIVDEFTGRLMFGRRYSEGLHQAIEAKEGAKIQRESQTLATITFQNYFRLYEKLAGMTGTAATEAEEFAKIYKLEVVEVPTHRQMIRQDHSDRIYKSEMGKFQAVIKEIKERHAKGQPVLLGTISVEKNELLSELLSREGVPHEILNAKNHEKEAEIIAKAGAPGAVTLATNMAGRGVDIILAKESKEAGGLLVIGTERHESRRIDNQLRGRAGRQGDPGASQFYVSLEDDLMRIFGSDRIKRMMEFLKMPEDMPIENKMVSRSLESAQKKVEGNNFDIRKHLLDYDDVLNKHRTVIYRRRKEILEEYEREKAAVGGQSSTVILNHQSAETKDSTIVIPANAGIQSGSPIVVGDDSVQTLQKRVMELVEREIEQFVYYHTGGTAAQDWNIKEIYETAVTIFPIHASEKDELLSLHSRGNGRLDEAIARTEIIEFLVKLAKTRYEELKKHINNPELMLEVEKGMLLRSIDTLWVEHLVAIDYLRVGIGLRGYGQRDPLVEYKKEAYRLFNELVSSIQKEVVYSIYKVGIGLDLAPSLMERQGIRMTGAQKEAGATPLAPPKEFSHTDAGAKVGRNDSCPCGAKKSDGTPVKYKHCHGK